MLCFLLLTGCFTEKETASTETIEPEVSLAMMSEILEFSDGTGECETDSVACTTLSITYPYFTGTLNAEAEEKINDQIESVLTENVLYDSLSYNSIEEFSSSFISEFEEVKKEFDEAFGWKYEAVASVIRSDSNVVVLRAEKYIYTGGAHGMQLVHFVNFDPSTGERYSLDDVFSGEYGAKLNEQVQVSLRTAKGLQPGEDLSDQGFVFENDKYYNENFAILRDEIIFYFNQYEVAPYTAGPSEIRVPKASVQDILSPTFQD